MGQPSSVFPFGGWHASATPASYQESTSATLLYDDPGSTGSGVAVADAGLSETAALPGLDAVAGRATGTLSLPCFADDDPNATSGFTALVSWGDGSSSAAQVSANADGTFAVRAAHAYAAAGHYGLLVTVRHGGASTSAVLG